MKKNWIFYSIVFVMALGLFAYPALAQTTESTGDLTSESELKSESELTSEAAASCFSEGYKEGFMAGFNQGRNETSDVRSYQGEESRMTDRENLNREDRTADDFESGYEEGTGFYDYPTTGGKWHGPWSGKVPGN